MILKKLAYQFVLKKENKYYNISNTHKKIKKK